MLLAPALRPLLGRRLSGGASFGLPCGLGFGFGLVVSAVFLGVAVLRLGAARLRRALITLHQFGRHALRHARDAPPGTSPYAPREAASWC